MSTQELTTAHPARVVAGIATSSLKIFRKMGTPEEQAAAVKLRAKLEEWAKEAEASESAPGAQEGQAA